MKKYITSIEDLVTIEMTNGISEGDDSSFNFQRGLVNLLGIKTPVDIRKANQFLCNPSLKNDPDANCIMGFIAECEGNYSSSFKHYATAVENTSKKSDLSYLQKVIEGRNLLQKTFKQYNLSLTLNEELTKLLNDISTGDSKLKLDAKIITAYLCEDEATCIEAAQELFDVGEIYSSKLLLQKGKVDNSYSLYNKIDMQALESKGSIMSCVGSIVELEGESILPNFENILSIANVKKKCEDCSKECSREWISANKTLIGRMVESQKSKIDREKAKKEDRNMAILFWLILPVVIFIIFNLIAYFISGSLDWTLGGFFVVLYYGVAAYVRFKILS